MYVNKLYVFFISYDIDQPPFENVEDTINQWSKKITSIFNIIAVSWVGTTWLHPNLKFETIYLIGRFKNTEQTIWRLFYSTFKWLFQNFIAQDDKDVASWKNLYKFHDARNQRSSVFFFFLGHVNIIILLLMNLIILLSN